MTLPRLQLSVIGDEIGSSLDEMISFAHEHGLTRLDMRTVGGRNLLAMKTEEVIPYLATRAGNLLDPTCYEALKAVVLRGQTLTFLE